MNSNGPCRFEPMTGRSATHRTVASVRVENERGNVKFSHTGRTAALLLALALGACTTGPSSSQRIGAAVTQNGEAIGSAASMSPTSSTEWVHLHLDHGVQIEVPASWRPTDPKLRDAYMARRLGASGYVGLIARSELQLNRLLEVQASSATYGPRVLITSRMPSSIRPATISDPTERELALYSKMTEQALGENIAAGGQRLVRFTPLRKANLGGRAAFFMEAEHTTREGRNLLLRQYLVATDQQELRVSIHLPSDELALLLPTVRRIEQSIAIDTH